MVFGRGDGGRGGWFENRTVRGVWGVGRMVWCGGGGMDVGEEEGGWICSGVDP